MSRDRGEGRSDARGAQSRDTFTALDWLRRHVASDAVRRKVKQSIGVAHTGQPEKANYPMTCQCKVPVHHSAVPGTCRQPVRLPADPTHAIKSDPEADTNEVVGAGVPCSRLPRSRLPRSRQTTVEVQPKAGANARIAALVASPFPSAESSVDRRAREQPAAERASAVPTFATAPPSGSQQTTARHFYDIDARKSRDPI